LSGGIVVVVRYSVRASVFVPTADGETGKRAIGQKESARNVSSATVK